MITKTTIAEVNNFLSSFYLPVASKTKNKANERRFHTIGAVNHDYLNNLSQFLSNKDSIKTFSELLFEYIDNKNLTDSYVYKKALIDRRLFSKIRSQKKYQPKKETVLALILALELSEDDAISLLSAAGFSLSSASKSDLILLYCIKKKLYNILDVNYLLHEHNLKPLRI